MVLTNTLFKMKVNELRLQNLVYVFNKQIAEISTIGYDGCWVNLLEPDEYQSTSHDIESINIEPIQLTEEWLVKMGGITTGDSTWLDFIISSHTPFVSYNHTDKCFYFHTAALEDKFSFKVLYVHQLQNLYFALTGEELKINLVVTK